MLTVVFVTTNHEFSSVLSAAEPVRGPGRSPPPPCFVRSQAPKVPAEPLIRFKLWKRLSQWARVLHCFR